MYDGFKTIVLAISVRYLSNLLSYYYDSDRENFRLPAAFSRSYGYINLNTSESYSRDSRSSCVPSASSTPTFQCSPLPTGLDPRKLFGVLLRRCARVQRSWLELIKYQLPSATTLANAFSGDLDTTIEEGRCRPELVPHRHSHQTRRC
jgi:hypothetical protein